MNQDIMNLLVLASLGASAGYLAKHGSKFRSGLLVLGFIVTAICTVI